MAIQGVEGSYHAVAAGKYYGEGVEVEGCLTFKEVVRSVKSGRVDSGLMAIENTIAGSLLQNHELLRGSEVWVSGEMKMRISHSLVALAGTGIGELKEVWSHPIALAQCMEYLDKLEGVRLVETEDTALSAREIAEGRRGGVGALCSRLTGEKLGLSILAEGIETNTHNFTRFLVLEGESLGEAERRESNKASLVFSLPHSSGSLSAVLSILSYYGMSLTKIQSLPIIGREWEYLFYIDLTYKDYGRYGQSLEAIKPLISDFRILGEYKEGEVYA